MTPDGQINPDIQAERGWNFELGTKGKSNDERWSYDLSIYQMLIKDLLVARRTDFDQFRGVNAGKTKHNGLELQLQYALIQSLDQRLSMSLNYQFSDYSFTEFVDLEQDYSGNQLTGTPRHLLTLQTHFSYKNLYANLLYRFIDKMPLRDDNSVFSNSSNIVDLKFGYHQQVASKIDLGIQFGINNVFDTRYASMYLINAASFGNNPPRYYYPGLPRNVFLSLNVRYNL